MWIKENWEIVALVVGGIGTAYNFISDKWKEILSSPFTRNKQEIESVDLSNDQLERFKNNILLLQAQSIEQGERIVRLHKEINENQIKYNQELTKTREQVIRHKQALAKLVSLCDIMCGEKEKCKDAIRAVMEDLDIIEVNDAEEIN